MLKEYRLFPKEPIRSMLQAIGGDGIKCGTTQNKAVFPFILAGHSSCAEVN